MSPSPKFQLAHSRLWRVGMCWCFCSLGVIWSVDRPDLLGDLLAQLETAFFGTENIHFYFVFHRFFKSHTHVLLFVSFFEETQAFLLFFPFCFLFQHTFTPETVWTESHFTMGPICCCAGRVEEVNARIGAYYKTTTQHPNFVKSSSRLSKTTRTLIHGNCLLREQVIYAE